MKKKLITFMFVILMTFAFAIPIVATEAVVSEPTNVGAKQEIAPFHEFTRAYFRTYHGQLQMRIWGMTSGRWLTDWMNLYEA